MEESDTKLRLRAATLKGRKKLLPILQRGTERCNKIPAPTNIVVSLQAPPLCISAFEHFVSYPLGIVPKGKYRVIHDQSFPKHRYVNHHIPQENSSVQYESIDNVIPLLNQFGSVALMAMTDIKDAFRIIPIHPDAYKLLGFSYHDKCLPMGSSCFCKNLESLSQSLQLAMYSKFNAAGMSHMLDIFFCIGPKQSHKCLHDLNQFIFMCKDSGIPIKIKQNSDINHSYNYLLDRSSFQIHDMQVI